MVNKDLKIYVAGHKGMVGSACVNILNASGYKNIIGVGSNILDLRKQTEVYKFLSLEKPDVIIDCAARVGGIMANKSYPYEFLLHNMQIQNNLICSAHELDINKFIFLGSSCIYPKLAPQPLIEDYLLTDSLEPTNEPYAIAKISGIKLIEALRNQYDRDYVSLMPTNLYGPGDNFDLESSHVIPALIHKFHKAKKENKNYVTLWGTGTPRREFLHVEDLADAILFSLENKLPDNIYNIGSGIEHTISDIAVLIKNIVDYNGKIRWDKSKPDGTPRKLLDSSKINSIGWKAKRNISEEIENVYNWFKENKS